MWLSKILIIPVFMLMLAACSGTISEAELGQVTVTTDSTRIGQLYSQRLNRLLARHAQSAPRYELTTGLKAVESEDSVTMSARLSLYDRTTGQIITTKSLGSSASIGATASLYGAEEAKRFARERLASHLAEKTYHYLIIYFARDT